MLDSLLKVLRDLSFRYKLGVVGSVARGTYSDSSDIDIVVDGDMLNLYEIDLIKNTIKRLFNHDCDVIQLPLAAKKEDIELDGLSQSLGLGINEDSSYKNMIKDVIWCE